MGWINSICCLLLLFLVGCWDINEADRMDYAYAFGLDYANGQVIVHMQLVNLASLGTPEIASETIDQVVIATAKGTTINQAVHEIYQSAQQRVYLGHNTSVILTEAALENGKLKEVIDAINRFPDTRYRTNIFATNDNIKDLFEASTIFKGTPILTRITDLQNVHEQSNRVDNVSLRELIIALDEPNHQASIPLIAVEDVGWETADKQLIMIKDDGLALVTSDNLLGILRGDDVLGFRWTIDATRNNVTMLAEDRPLGDLIVTRPKDKWTIHPDEHDIKFELEITGRAMVDEIMEDLSEEEIINLAEQKIEEEVMRTYKKALEMNADVYRLSEKVYRHHLKTWRKLNVDGTIPLSEDSLEVHAKIHLSESSVDTTEPVVD